LIIIIIEPFNRYGYLAESDTDKVWRWKGGWSGANKTQKGFDGNRNMGHGKGKKKSLNSESMI